MAEGRLKRSVLLFLGQQFGKIKTPTQITFLPKNNILCNVPFTDLFTFLLMAKK